MCYSINSFGCGAVAVEATAFSPPTRRLPHTEILAPDRKNQTEDKNRWKRRENKSHSALERGKQNQIQQHAAAVQLLCCSQ